MPPLQSKVEYNDLNGEEVKEILHSRFYDLLNQIPELQPRFALTRAILRLELAIDIYGATPPKKIIHDKFEIIARELPQTNTEPVAESHVLTANIDARENPPDLIREEHGLPLPRAVRAQAGMLTTSLVEPEDQPKYAKPPQPLPAHLLPANAENPTAKQVGRRKYAAFVEQDYGSLEAGDRKGGEGPIIGAEKIAESGSAGSDHAPAQIDFRIADYRGVGQDKAREVVQDTVERGHKVDQTLINNRRKGK